MPAVTFNLFDKFRRKSQIGAGVNIVTPGGNGIKCAIVTAAYTLDQQNHDNWDDANTNEVTGAGYTAGGNLMANGSVGFPDGAGLVTVDIDDPATWSFNASGFANGRRAIVYLDTGTASTSTLIGFSADFGSDQGNAAGDFSVQVNASGLYTMPR